MEQAAATTQQVLEWYRTLSNWGRWGYEDERGTLNLITPAKVQQAAGLVRDGVVVSCTRPMGYDPVPDAPIPSRHFMLKSGEGEPAESVGRFSALDAFLFAPHGRTMTHLDAPAHTLVRASESEPWTMYNGKSKDLVSTVQGATAGSIELAAGGIVTRGVLLDIARLRGVDWLGKDGASPADLAAAESAAGITVEAGDVLFVRTGWPKQRAQEGPLAAGGGVGLRVDCLPWLRERDVVLLSTDTSNGDDVSLYAGLGSNGGIHGVGMGAIGLWILDNADFEELAQTCERLGRWEFEAVVAPLKLERGTGSPVNPLAIF